MLYRLHNSEFIFSIWTEMRIVLVCSIDRTRQEVNRNMPHLHQPSKRSKCSVADNRTEQNRAEQSAGRRTNNNALLWRVSQYALLQLLQVTRSWKLYSTCKALFAKFVSTLDKKKRIIHIFCLFVLAIITSVCRSVTDIVISFIADMTVDLTR